MAIDWDTDRTELDHFNAEYAAELAAESAPVERYSDEWLTEAENGPFAGDRNSAPYLRELDTVERRKRAVSEAHTLSNISGGRYSYNVSRAVSEILAAIRKGTEGEMLYGEKFAHDAREAEKALRERTGNPNAIHYPAGLRKY